METTIIILAVSIAVSFLYGLITKNYSTVDRLWSILPVVYLLVWISETGFTLRYSIVFVLVFLWGARLTTNFALKGGYSFNLKKGFTGEDYRWSILRKRINNNFMFEIFNLLFISGFQLVLIFVFTLPLYYYGRIDAPLAPVEILLFFIHLLLLAGETAADIQQLRFYKRRYDPPWSNEERYKLGFNTFGLWKISRHPNYVCEMSQWVAVYLYLASASGGMHFSGFGALALILLFAGSTRFAEEITASKYERYDEWKKLTSVWIPVKSIFLRSRRLEFLKDSSDNAVISR